VLSHLPVPRVSPGGKGRRDHRVQSDRRDHRERPARLVAMDSRAPQVRRANLARKDRRVLKGLPDSPVREGVKVLKGLKAVRALLAPRELLACRGARVRSGPRVCRVFRDLPGLRAVRETRELRVLRAVRV
jgi:hypothetical protein